MKLEFLEGAVIDEVSKLSQAVGNIPLDGMATVMRNNDGDIVAFTAVQGALHAAGSWVRPDLRQRRYTYELRALLESKLRERGVNVYFAVPNTEFERALFAKYGPITERVIQVKEL